MLRFGLLAKVLLAQGKHAEAEAEARKHMRRAAASVVALDSKDVVGCASYPNLGNRRIDFKG